MNILRISFNKKINESELLQEITSAYQAADLSLVSDRNNHILCFEGAATGIQIQVIIDAHNKTTADVNEADRRKDFRNHGDHIVKAALKVMHREISTRLPTFPDLQTFVQMVKNEI